MPRKLIMCGDHPVLAFEYDPESGRACSSGEVLDHDRLPLEFTTHGKSALYARRIDEWWKSRAIPSTRDGIRRVLESLGAASTGELLDRTYGLSLSDQYWVRREDDPAEWKDVNFFDNPFDEALGEILLTSYSSSHDISLNAPDVSTGGDLPKRWTINKNTGRRLLVKSGRTGQEPMNEVIASRLCMRLGVPAVRYSLARNGNRLVSTCADMLSNHEELVSAWQVLQSVKAVNGLNSHDQWIRAAVGFGADERAVRDATDDWLVVDYLMRNTDRHYNNFGLIRNIETLAVRPAPIYDTGASLWSGELDVDGRDWFAKPFYSATGRPSALRQLRLVEDWSRFDLDALSDWPDEVAHELSRMRMFAPERLDAIRVQLVKRIGMLRRNLGRVQAERFDHSAMDGRMIGLGMGQRQSDVFIKRETTHARNVNGLVLDDLGERLIGGQRAGASGQAQHGVRLCFDQVRHATAVDLAGLGFVLDNDDFRHRFPPVPCGPPDASRCTAARLADNGNILVTSGCRAAFQPPFGVAPIGDSLFVNDTN